MTKRLIYGAIKNNVLTQREFEFIISKTVHLANRRLVAFKEYLRDFSNEEYCPEPITPEELIHGYKLVSINLIPVLQDIPDKDVDWHPDPTTNIKNNQEKLAKVRSELVRIYHEEFLVNLVQQAISEKDRYKPVGHACIEVGDLVLMKEPLLKSSQYPIGIVKEKTENSNGEVTGVVLRKGNTRETVKRHISCIIPYLSGSPENQGALTVVKTRPCK